MTAETRQSKWSSISAVRRCARISLRTARSREEQKLGGWYLVDNNVVRKGFNRAELENYLCEGGFLKEHEYLAA